VDKEKDMETIYSAHAKSVYKYIFSLCGNSGLAEELTQETFYRAVCSLDSYNGSCKVFTWLCQIAKHIWYQEIDRKKRRPATELTREMIETISGGSMTPEESAVKKESRAELYQKIHNLEEGMKEVMLLRLSGDFSFREIGEITGRDENWARVTFYRGKQKIMKGMRHDEL